MTFSEQAFEGLLKLARPAAEVALNEFLSEDANRLRDAERYKHATSHKARCTHIFDHVLQ